MTTRERRWTHPSPVAQAAIAAILSLLLALLAIRAWRLSLTVPFEYSGDSLLGMTWFKGALEGWPLEFERLGAPFQGQLYDFPQGDNLHFLTVKTLGLVTGGDPALVLNLFFLLTFPTAAVAAWWVFRDLGMGPLAAIVCAVLFALLPYHFWRGEGHILLSAYYSVPLGCWLTLRVLQSREIFRTNWRDEASRREKAAALLPLLFCLVIGSTGVYYAAFSCLLLAGAAILVGWRREGRRAAAQALVAAAVILLTLAVNLSPSIAYRSAHGENDQAAVRTPDQSETLGLSLVGMLLPAQNHRFEPFANATDNFRESTVIPGESSSLGLIASAGFVALLAIIGISTIWGGSVVFAPQLRAAAAAAGVAFMIGTVGGLSDLVARAFSPDLRSWNRFSVFVAFFALVAVGFAIARCVRALARRNRGPALAGVLVVLILGFGVYDQAVPAHDGQFDPDYVEPRWRSDAAFAKTLERRLPAGAAVLQLPYVPYPEGYAPAPASGYDSARGYIHTEELRWSFGAMRNRSADVGACLASVDTDRVVVAAKAIGFGAIWVDRWRAEPQVADDVEDATDGRTVVSPDGRFVAVALSGVRVAQPLREAISEAMPDSEDDLQDCTDLTRAVRRA